jgi:hypothetical protein
MNANVEAHLLTETLVLAFHYEHGIDPLERRIWELEWPVEPSAEVVEEDPLRAEVSLEFDGDRLVVTVDEDAEIAAVSRENAR